MTYRNPQPFLFGELAWGPGTHGPMPTFAETDTASSYPNNLVSGIDTFQACSRLQTTNTERADANLHRASDEEPCAERFRAPLVQSHGIAAWRDSVQDSNARTSAASANLCSSQLASSQALRHYPRPSSWSTREPIHVSNSSHGSRGPTCRPPTFNPGSSVAQTQNIRSLHARTSQQSLTTPETTSSPESVFSKVSPTSSSSSATSVSDQSVSSYQINQPSAPRYLPPQHQSSNCQQQQWRHPRRTVVDASWTKPALIREHARRQELVNKLVESATALVKFIWPTADQASRCDLARSREDLTLGDFIQETLRRSRTSYSTLQLTLWYLALIYPKLPHGQFIMEQSGDSPFFRSILCGRRMFLAALMLASKFLQDRNFTARAWSKITGLPAREITNNEFGFVQSIGWKLHLQGEDFIHWNRIVICCTEADKLNKQTNSVWASVLDSCKQGESLAQVSSQLFSHLRLPAHITSFVDGSKTHVEPSKSSDLSAQIVPTTPCPASQDTKSHTLNVVLTPPSSQGSMASMPLARATNRESSNTMLNRQASETSIFGCPPQTGPHGLPTPATDLSETSDFSGSVTWRSNNSNSFGRWPVRSQDDYSSMTSSEEGINAAQLQAWVNEQQSADQWIAMLAEAADVSMNADKSSNKDGSGTQAMLQKPLLNDVECNVSLDDDSSGIDANDQTHVSFNLEPSSDDLQQLVRADLAASSERSQSRCQVQDDGPTVVDSNAVSLARNIINLPTSTSSTEPQTGSKRPMSSSFAPAARCMKAACIR